jgi:hypothetical protein
VSKVPQESASCFRKVHVLREEGYADRRKACFGLSCSLDDGYEANFRTALSIVIFDVV